jgi:hypothetical protein
MWWIFPHFVIQSLLHPAADLHERSKGPVVRNSTNTVLQLLQVLYKDLHCHRKAETHYPGGTGCVFSNTVLICKQVRNYG